MLLDPRKPQAEPAEIFQVSKGLLLRPLGSHYSGFACLAFKRGLLSSSKVHVIEGLPYSEQTQALSAKEQVWKEISERLL